MATECKSLKPLESDAFELVSEVITHKLNHIPIIKGDFGSLPQKVQRFIAEKAELMQPSGIFICDGSQKEFQDIVDKLVERGVLTPLKAYEHNYLCRTDPKDVARVESKTWMITKDKYQSVCHTPDGVKPIMGQWMSEEQFAKELDDRFPGCMAGRPMYVVPFSMGPIGGPLSKIGIELTDSCYVVLCMQIMTRMGTKVIEALGDGDFVRGIHSVGQPRPVKVKVINHWPCNPEKVMISHRPKEREIWSFGSGYGGNSLLGKKCFALRIAMNIGHDEGWMAEHMLIMGITNPQGKERFVAAAFPSACGKTNLAMLQPTIPGWKVQVIGDDIAWMKFGADGRLYAINPESGFFGVAPGTSYKTNPMAMESFQKNSIFTNVAETEDGEYFWEGLEKDMMAKRNLTAEQLQKIEIINWLGEKWHIGEEGKAAHPNSRFTAPAGQCPIIHPRWEAPEGVPIDAIIFGGRRPEGVPLVGLHDNIVFESFSWEHGILVGALVKSEATAAAEHTGKQVMHDPMAMRPFMGYNFGQYLQHWINLGQPPHKVPKIFHVNWFRETKDHKFLWPGYGDNIRVLDWILRRVDGVEDIAEKTPIGYVPKKGTINLDGLPRIDWDELMSIPKQYWEEDIEESKHFLDTQVGPDLPKLIADQLEEQAKRIHAL
ncbi:phosphoenolpyruvate carboxykinase [Oesophagostomum dentatum]|uniref:Phosphoenolpyruvate carboxykinase [GTP] n=1 Tax=Oesophagostomum dentatum TaxID=61180 RepID=A0A0B1TP92_OESDE|nr:phosphoenolpyruvate carboxykinase [Oesophagostomum dentatum]